MSPKDLQALTFRVFRHTMTPSKYPHIGNTQKMNAVSRHTLLLFCLLCSFLGADSPDTILSPAQQQEDFDFFWQSLNNVHPLPDYACPMADLQARAAVLRSKLDQPRAISSFFCHLAPLIAMLRDSHTRLSYPPFPAQQLFPPFDLLVQDRQIFLRRDYTASLTHHEGHRIRAINGHDSSEILSAMMGLMAGETDEIRSNALASDAFKVLWACLYPSETSFRLSWSDGSESQVAGLTRAAIRSLRPPPPQEKTGLSWSIREGTAHIRIHSFEGVPEKKAWRRALTEINQQHPQSILLDLRGNAGGDTDLAEGVAATFLARGVRFCPFVAVRCSALLREKARQKIPGFLRLFHLENLSRSGRAFFKAPLGSLLDLPDSDPPSAPMAPPCSLPLFLLIDGGSASSAALLARTLQQSGRALLLGRPAGSAQEGLFGESLTLTLPHSQLSLVISTMVLRLTPTLPFGPCTPLTPDRVLTAHAQQEARGTDSLLEQALGWIRAPRATSTTPQEAFPAGLPRSATPNGATGQRGETDRD